MSLPSQHADNASSIVDTANLLDATNEEQEFHVHGTDDLVNLIHVPEWKTILLDLVRKEQMDVWAIDIGLLAEKYLKKIEQLQDLSLRIPANAILASAILLHLKSKTIRFPWLEKKQPELTEEEKQAFLSSLPDLTTSFKLREGTITLDELVTSIEDVMGQMKSKDERLNKPKEIFIPQFTIPLSRENWDEKISNVFSQVKTKVDAQGLTLFSHLLADSTADNKINVFIPLLFLMNEGKVLMFQEIFFDEIFIQLLNPNLAKIEEGVAEE